MRQPLQNAYLKPIEHDLSSGLPITRVVAGEVVVARAPMVFTTVLGSCVTACVSDRVAGVFGINHFMLPGGNYGPVARHDNALRYGLHAMDTLFNALRVAGAETARLVVKVFGGAALREGSRIAQVGPANVAFVLDYLAAARLRISAQDLGGVLPRRLRFSSAEATVQCSTMTIPAVAAIEPAAPTIRSSL